MLRCFFLITLLLCALAAEAAEPCYSKFSVPVDKAIQGISQSCKALEKDIPSDCQRSSGMRCQKSYNEARRVRAEVCSALAGDADFIKASQHSEGVASQKDSQDANSALHSDTATISEGMAKNIQGEWEKIGAVIKENEIMIRAEQCTRNASQSVYAGRMQAVNNHLAVIRAHLDTLAKKKKSDAAQANTVSAISDQHTQNLTSVNPALSEDSEEGENKWLVPALAAGGAAAALYAILKLKDKGAPAPPADLDDVYDPEPGPGGQPPSQRGEPPPPFQGNPGEFLDTYGVRVDPSFSDSTKRQIANAVNYFPECWRKSLAGSVIRSNPGLKWKNGQRAGDCLPGQNTGMKPPTVQLNETCRTGMGTYTALVVHELMHVLANRRGLYARYNKAFRANPGCGVSRYSHVFYGGKNLNEDFAEAGRFVFYPASGQMYGGACVNNRIQAAREILNSCK